MKNISFERIVGILSSDYLLCFLVSFLVSGMLIYTKKWHGVFSMDTTDGVQKFHVNPTPRIGGMPVLFGLVAVATLSSNGKNAVLLNIIFASIPAFIAGTIEDITKNVGVKYRLIATMLSGVVACFLSGYSITSVEVPGIDFLLKWMPFSVFFTMICVAGVANAVNIIDGFNGLAGGFLIVAYLGLALISSQVGDYEVMSVCLVFSSLVLGFFVFNFPYGKLFLGDGGAYLLGFALAWIAVILPFRNPSVSHWAMLVICAYPVLEVMFSIFRKQRREGHHPGQPDKVHLHMLVYKRVVLKRFREKSAVILNSLTSIIIWPYAIGSTIIGVVLYESTLSMFFALLVLIVIYHVVYVRLIRFHWTWR
jgi:UDP-N-acetylmuramyl pentapeptide phosphotransferase/UDP-N-acetylglucosamine-1-phosphate transferase